MDGSESPAKRTPPSAPPESTTALRDQNVPFTETVPIIADALSARPGGSVISVSPSTN